MRRGTTELCFDLVGQRSLGEALAEYGVISVVGEIVPEARFWWEDDERLRAELPEGWSEVAMAAAVGQRLLGWASRLSVPLAAFWKGGKTDGGGGDDGDGQSRDRNAPFTKLKDLVDGVESWIASQAPDESRWLAGIVPEFNAGQEASSPAWFPAYGQDARTNYFATFDRLARNLALPAGVAPGAGGGRAGSPYADLEAICFRRREGGHGIPDKDRRLATGGIFIPDASKRYATGSAKWVREDEDSSVTSGWLFLLALRGALEHRFGLRRRGRAKPALAFPGEFPGPRVAVEAEGKKQEKLLTEYVLPRWGPGAARSLLAWRLQRAQALLRVGGDAIAERACEYLAAVHSRGSALGYSRILVFRLEPRLESKMGKATDYRFVAVLRGIVAPRDPSRGDSPDVRAMIAPLAEAGWLGDRRWGDDGASSSGDAVRRQALLARRSAVEAAIDRLALAPRHDEAVAVLRAIWEANASLAEARAAGLGDIPPPAPPLPARPWLAALRLSNPLERIARAIAAADLLEDLLPVRRTQERLEWSPEPAVHRIWSLPAALFFRRLLALRRRRREGSQEKGALGLGSVPDPLCAPTEDLAELFAGAVDLAALRDLVLALAVLDWRGERKSLSPESRERGDPGRASAPPRRRLPPLPAAFLVLRRWLGWADASPPIDDPRHVLPLLEAPGPEGAARAVRAAWARLRIRRALPERRVPRDPEIRVEGRHADLLPVALLVPIPKADRWAIELRLLLRDAEQVAERGGPSDAEQSKAEPPDRSWRRE